MKTISTKRDAHVIELTDIELVVLHALTGSVVGGGTDNVRSAVTDGLWETFIKDFPICNHAAYLSSTHQEAKHDASGVVEFTDDSLSTFEKGIESFYDQDLEELKSKLKRTIANWDIQIAGYNQEINRLVDKISKLQ